LILHTITNKLRRITPQLVSSLTQKLLKTFFITFKKNIWIPRCDQMNKYEASLGISPVQKKDYKTYRPIVCQENYLAYQQNNKWRTKERLHHCKEAITSLIVKGSIPVWGIKGFNKK
jgi:hypothetical protein